MRQKVAVRKQGIFVEYVRFKTGRLDLPKYFLKKIETPG